MAVTTEVVVTMEVLVTTEVVVVTTETMAGARLCNSGSPRALYARTANTLQPSCRGRALCPQFCRRHRVALFCLAGNVLVVMRRLLEQR